MKTMCMNIYTIFIYLRFIYELLNVSTYLLGYFEHKMR